MNLKKILSTILCSVIVAGGVLPCISAVAVVKTVTYWAKDCTDAAGSSAAFATQLHNQNNVPTGEGEFSRFDGAKIGDYAVYVIDAAAAGEYDFSVRYRAHESTSKSNDVYVNDVKLSVPLNQIGTPNAAYNADMGKVHLNAGKNTIKFVITAASTNNNYRLNLFTFSFSYDDGKEPGENDIPIGVVGGSTGNLGTTDGTSVVYNGVNCQSTAYSNASFAPQTTGAYTFSRFDATELNSYATYVVNVKAAGKYKLLIRYRSHESVGKAHFYLNGERQEKEFKSTGAANSFYQTNMGVYDFVTGDNYIQFQMYEPGSGGTYKLNIVDFTLAVPVEEELNGYTELPGGTSDKVISYAFQSIYKQSSVFSLKADGVAVPVVSYTDSYDYAQFSFKGKEQPISLEITYSSVITSYSISPLKYGIKGTVSGNKLTFTIDKNSYLIVRINGSNKRIVITADPPETDVPSSSGEGIFNVTAPQFGADKTGKESSYTAIQQAVDAASTYGSTEGNQPGVVYVPSGVYFIGSLELKSNVKLYLEGGAVLRASKNAEDFLAKGKKSSLGLPITYLIFTQMHSSNIKIYGRGTVDGDGYNVRALGFALQTLSPNNTSYFTSDGITYRDSGMWSIVPAWSDNLNFLNLKMFNTIKLGEDDGIDICGCQNVLVQNAIGIMWDDPFSTKAYGVNSEISGGWGKGPVEINDTITFDNCVSWTGCYGFKVGQGFTADQQNITFKNGTVYECAVGIGIHYKQGGAKCENITFENIDIESICSENDGHRTWFVGYIQSSSGTGGPVTNVTVKDINVRDSSQSTPKLLGKSDEIMISDVFFENITFQGNTGAATTLVQMGFTEEYSKYSKNCYVINPVNAKTPAGYYSSASSASIVSDQNAEMAKAVRTTGGTVLYYKGIDFGELARQVNIRYASNTASDIQVCLDNRTNMIGKIQVSAGGSDKYSVGSVDLDKITGIHDVYLITGSGMKVDWLQVYSDPKEADQAAAAAVDELIEKIGEITVNFESEDTITSAENAYNRLTSTQKELVKHYENLLKARAEYNNLTAARSVDLMISNIGDLNDPVTDAQKEAVLNARKAYNLLTAAQKVFVTKLDELELAEEKIIANDLIKGDIDGDKKVNVSDVVALRSSIMKGSLSDEQKRICDVDGDEKVDVSDVVALRTLIMKGIVQ